HGKPAGHSLNTCARRDTESKRKDMIQTKIARILSPTQVILAAGSKQGVQEGMKFLIYELGDNILDPETGQVLGQLELIKGRVQVQHVQENLSHAATPGKSVTEEVDPLAALSVMHPRRVTRFVQPELPVEGVMPIDQKLIVRVGDMARTIE